MRKLTITVAELSAALRDWDKQSKEEDWPDRADDGRFDDNANYLFDRIEDNVGKDPA